jgi:hypothetical protein
MRSSAADGIVAGMEHMHTQDYGADLGEPEDHATNEDELVRAWREEQLRALGLLPALARAFADHVDWHELATLVKRGCPPGLALEIVW